MRTSATNLSAPTTPLVPNPSADAVVHSAQDTDSSSDPLPDSARLPGAMENARHRVESQAIQPDNGTPAPTAITAALDALEGKLPQPIGFERADFPPQPVNPNVDVEELHLPESSTSGTPDNLVSAIATPENDNVPTDMLAIIEPVIRGVGNRFPEGHNRTLVGVWNPELVPGMQLGTTIRYPELRTALIRLNPDISADVENASPIRRQASYAATLAHEYLRHVVPFMSALAAGMEEESDGEEHRQMFVPADIDTNTFYQDMLAVRNELPRELRTPFMQSYANSVASYIDRLARESEEGEANDFLDDIRNSHNLE